MGGFVLENFLIKKEGCAKNPYLLHRFSKNARRFFPKTKSPRKRRANFFCLVVETPLKKLRLYTPVYVPFTAKRGQLRQSSKVKSCIRIARRRVEMTEVMVEAVEIF